MRNNLILAGALLAASIPALNMAQEEGKRPAEVQAYISVEAPVVALTHVRVIDGTGAAPLLDQTIVIEGGRIKSTESAAKNPAPSGAKVLDLTGATVIPGLVGMHDHLFYPSGSNESMAIYNEMGFSAPRLYLACGVTTIRTTGSIEPYTDLSLKKMIDTGKHTSPDLTWKARAPTLRKCTNCPVLTTRARLSIIGRTRV
jgi:imidazolonepropionase-like amidohydrolase